jgi:predicted enzyme related to lactoylglutathione lyase
MGKVVGLGGIFVHLKGETKDLYDWYEKNLGLDMTEYGTGFLEGEQLVLISLKRNQENAPFLNFRVDELNEIITRLKTMNITIISDVKPYTYGLFATFMDPFGNAIELWEPYVDAYKEMVLKEISDYKLKKKK